MLINEIKNNYAMIASAIISDKEVSNGAFRVYCYLASKPTGWNVYNDDICKQLGVMESKTISGYYRNLIDAGWISRIKVTIHNQDKYMTKCGTYVYTLYGEKTGTIPQNANNDNTPTNGKIPIQSKNDILNKNDKENTIYRELATKYKHAYCNLYPDSVTELERNFNEEQWGDTVDKLIRLDKHTLQEVREVLWFAMKDTFWSKQIRSLAGLRRRSNNGAMKFDNIKTAMKKTVVTPVTKQQKVRGAII